MSEIARFAVIGNPIAHSRSPQIHAAFAEATGRRLSYERLLAEPEQFELSVAEFFAEGGIGMNVTVPFKEQAFRMASVLSSRARLAGAVNTLALDDEGLYGDNTDGVGLVRDIEGRLGQRLAGRRVLLLGAGGAARGVIAPLLEAGVAELAVANRSSARATALVAELSAGCGHGGGSTAGGGGTSSSARNGGNEARLEAGAAARLCALADGQSWTGEILINATSAGLSDAAPALPTGALDAPLLAYEMVYGARPTPFMAAARAAGCPLVSDGLGMLVEQAAAAFALWHGVQPPSAPVYARLRAEIDGPATDPGRQ